MVKRQMELRLNAKAEVEAERVWRSIPPGNRREIARHHARVIGRAAKLVTSTRQTGADDEHTGTSHER